MSMERITYTFPKSQVKSEMKKGRFRSEVLTDFLTKSEKTSEIRVNFLKKQGIDKKAEIARGHTSIKEDSNNYIVTIAIRRSNSVDLL